MEDQGTAPYLEASANVGDLSAELALATGLRDPKTTVPIGACVLLRAKGARLELVVSDLERMLVTSCSADVIAEGSAAVPITSMHEYVRLLDASRDVRLVGRAGDLLNISCDASKTRLQGQSPWSFPEVRQMPEKVTATLAARDLARAIRQTLISVSKERGAQVYGHGLLQISSDGIEVATTDSHRLSVYKQRLDGVQLTGETRCLIQRKGLVNLDKMLSAIAGEDTGDERVEIAVEKNLAYFRAGPRTLSTRLSVAKFPDYQRVLPDKVGIVREFSSAELRATLNRVAKFSPSQSGAVAFLLEDGELRLTARDAMAGIGRETLPVDHDSSSFNVGFNARYILDFLDVCESDTVTVNLRDPKLPAEFRVERGRGDRLLRYVVMPIRA